MPKYGRCPTLIHPNEGNLKVRRRGSSNHLIFVMLWEDSNHLSPELPASTITTNLSKILIIQQWKQFFWRLIAYVQNCPCKKHAIIIFTTNTLKYCTYNYENYVNEKVKPRRWNWNYVNKKSIHIHFMKQRTKPTQSKLIKSTYH